MTTSKSTTKSTPTSRNTRNRLSRTKKWNLSPVSGSSETSILLGGNLLFDNLFQKKDATEISQNTEKAENKGTESPSTNRNKRQAPQTMHTLPISVGAFSFGKSSAI